MKKPLLTILLGFVAAFTYGKMAQQSIPPARYHVLMDAAWKFKLGDQQNAQNINFADAGWQNVDLPHDWSIAGEFSRDAATGGGGGYLPTGIGWYRKVFNLPAVTRGKQVNIQFDGVYQNSEVWINGHYLGKRPNGYISFVYDLTPFLKADHNVLAVKVDNSMQPNSRWYSGSGIYRHVWLNITNSLHVAQWGTYITTPQVSANAASISVKTKVENNGAAVEGAVLNAMLLDETGRTVATAKSSFSASANTNADVALQIQVYSPALWSVDQPHLYRLQINIQNGKKILDTYAQSFGIRSLAYSNTDGFLLNGKPLKMNGVCLHHDGGCVGAAVPIKIWEQRLTRLKEMGCNAIRTSHNPPAPEFLDLCDKMGFLVMDEAFDVWESGKVKNDYHLYFDEWAQQDLIAQIYRDRNHPSVVLWSAGNEIPDQTSDKGVELLKGLMATFHNEDPTRPVTTANDDIAADGGQTKLDFMNAEDIVGYNYVDRWHERRELFYDIDRHDHPAWKMIGTESEAMRSVAEYSLGTNPAKVSPNYTSGLVRAEQLWKFVAVHNYVIGDFMWTGIDYLGEARWPGKGSSSGVIDMCNAPKDAFYFYQSQWTTKPVLHVLPHWTWPGREGQVIPVTAFTNCDTVELFVNGKSYGIKTQEFPRQGNSGAWNKYSRPYVNGTTADLHLSWDVVYQPGTIKAIGRKNGKQVIIDEIKTAGKPAALRIVADTASISTEGANNVVTIRVDVLDQDGQVVPLTNNLVTFDVQGKGKLLGVDNGNQSDDRSFSSPQRNAFKGHVYAVVGSNHSPGDIIVTASADGLKLASIKIIAEKKVSPDLLLENLK